MSRIDEAKAIIAETELTAELANLEDAICWSDGAVRSGDDMSPEFLATTLSYQVELKGQPIKDEQTERIGITKYRGLPHLPKNLEWPAGMLFAAQINLSDLAEVDVSQRLPKSGMLYLFFDSSGAECEVIHWDGDLAELEVRAYPDAATISGAEYYLEEFLKGERCSLAPYWIIYVGDGDVYDYRDTRKRLDDKMVEAVSAKLGASIATWDKTCRLYGRPFYWQGEDEDGMPTDFDEDGLPIFGEPRIELLLFQDEFGEGNIHFWCEFDAAAKGDFSEVWLGYSGT